MFSHVTSFNGQTFQYFNFHQRLETLSTSADTLSFTFDGLERLESIAHPRRSDATTTDEEFIYGDLSNNVSAIASTTFNVQSPPDPPPILSAQLRVGYDGVDHPLWIQTGSLLEYPELESRHGDLATKLNARLPGAKRFPEHGLRMGGSLTHAMGVSGED